MLRKISNLDRPHYKNFFRPAALVLFALSCSFAPTFAQQAGQRTFASAQDAGRALIAAMQPKDEGALLSILGPAGKDVISSGDLTEDLNHRAGFVVQYQQMHRYVKESNGTVTLLIGAEKRPFPIPLVNNRGSWYFDTPAAKGGMLSRRMGRNEIAAMDACRELVEAQKQYFARQTNRPSRQYALKLVSDEGRHNGLYWQGASNSFDSPINPLIAYAYGNGPNNQAGLQVPYNGYFFRILTSQGPHAPGGARNYVVDGKMTAGFAFVAYPAEYGSSGGMTFIVGESGTIFKKDLGPDTTNLAETMTAYDPDSTWNKVN